MQRKFVLRRLHIGHARSEQSLATEKELLYGLQELVKLPVISGLGGEHIGGTSASSILIESQRTSLGNLNQLGHPSTKLAGHPASRRWRRRNTHSRNWIEMGGFGKLRDFADIEIPRSLEGREYLGCEGQPGGRTIRRLSWRCGVS